MMTVSFIISWGPFAWIYLLPLLGFENEGPSQPTDAIPLLTAKLGSAIVNPMVYVFGNSEVNNINVLQKVKVNVLTLIP